MSPPKGNSTRQHKKIREGDQLSLIDSIDKAKLKQGRQLALAIDIKNETRTVNMAVVPIVKSGELTLIYLHDISYFKKLQDI